MKKLLSVLMASVLCVGIFAGCGANKTTETLAGEDTNNASLAIQVKP